LEEVEVEVEVEVWRWRWRWRWRRRRRRWGGLPGCLLAHQNSWEGACV